MLNKRPTERMMPGVAQLLRTRQFWLDLTDGQPKFGATTWPKTLLELVMLREKRAQDGEQAQPQPKAKDVEQHCSALLWPVQFRQQIDCA